MRYLISFILFLFCSASLFSQGNDTIEVKDTNKYIVHMLHINNDSITKNSLTYWCCSVNTIPTPPIHITRFPAIVHTNYDSHSLPLAAFRFENVNQIANTVAGVLSVDGETPSILGARREGTAYYINNVRVLEGFLPELVN